MHTLKRKYVIKCKHCGEGVERDCNVKSAACFSCKTDRKKAMTRYRYWLNREKA